MTPSRTEHAKMAVQKQLRPLRVNGQRGAKIPPGPRDESAHVRIVEPCRGQRETPRRQVQAGHLARPTRPTRRRTWPSSRSPWTLGRTPSTDGYAPPTSYSDVNVVYLRGWKSHTAASAERSLSRGLNRRRSSWFGTWPFAQDWV